VAGTKRTRGRRPARARQLPKAVDEGRESLDFYLQEISRIPLLTVEEETALARRAFKGDIEAQERLARHNVRFVVSVAKKFQNRGVPLMDLIGEGNVGLMKAVKRFDPDVGVRLVSFAVHWIRAEMHEFILKNWRIVKVATTKAQRKLFFNLRKSKKRLGWMNAAEVRAIAADLKVSEREVLEMESRLSGRDIGFDAPSDSGFTPVILWKCTSALRYEP